MEQPPHCYFFSFSSHRKSHTIQNFLVQYCIQKEIRKIQGEEILLCASRKIAFLSLDSIIHCCVNFLELKGLQFRNISACGPGNTAVCKILISKNGGRSHEASKSYQNHFSLCSQSKILAAPLRPAYSANITRTRKDERIVYYSIDNSICQP